MASGGCQPAAGYHRRRTDRLRRRLCPRTTPLPPDPRQGIQVFDVTRLRFE